MGSSSLIQRFAVENPSAPSGIAIIGTGKHPETFEPHYYDSRGVAHIYQMMSPNGACGRWSSPQGVRRVKLAAATTAATGR